MGLKTRRYIPGHRQRRPCDGRTKEFSPRISTTHPQLTGKQSALDTSTPRNECPLVLPKGQLAIGTGKALPSSSKAKGLNLPAGNKRTGTRHTVDAMESARAA